MEFEKLVSPITNYLTISIKFWSGDDSVFKSFANLTGVSPEALLFCLVGVAIGLLLRYARTGIVPKDTKTAPLSGNGPSLDSNALVLFTITSLLSPILLELAFWLLSYRPNVITTPAWATFNASFLTLGILSPISGVVNRWGSINSELQKVGGTPAKVSTLITVLIASLGLILMFKGLEPFWILLDRPLSVIWGAFALAFLITALLIFVFGYLLFHWNKYIFGEG